jgi:hypothetical protein
MQIDADQFDDQYQPLQNPHNKDAGWNGCLFETHGVEYNFVKNQQDRRVWTLLSDNTLVSGHRTVDRVGYIVTLIPWTEDTEVIL